MPNSDWQSESTPAASAPAQVREVVRAVVAEVAPEELPLVAGLARFDDATVVRRLSGRGGRREPLGFGLGEVAVLVTPVVWLVLNETAKKIAESAADETAGKARVLLRRVLRRRVPPVTVPPLTREQLVEVRRRVLETAVERGLSDKRAAVIADAVVVRLALTPPEVPAEALPAPPDAGAQG